MFYFFSDFFVNKTNKILVSDIVLGDENQENENADEIVKVENQEIIPNEDQEDNEDNLQANLREEQIDEEEGKYYLTFVLKKYKIF